MTIERRNKGYHLEIKMDTEIQNMIAIYKNLISHIIQMNLIINSLVCLIFNQKCH